SRRAISLIGTPSARCKRRISAQSSTFSTLQDLGGGQFSEYPRGSFFRVRRQQLPREANEPRAVARRVGVDGGSSVGRCRMSVLAECAASLGMTCCRDGHHTCSPVMGK